MNDLQKAQRVRLQVNCQKRRERLLLAREKGTHSKNDWIEMIQFFKNACVRCNEDEIDVVKDHIKPIYQGGSDGLENLQPLCRRCNSSKGPEDIDFRPQFALSNGLILPDKYKAKNNG